MHHRSLCLLSFLLVALAGCNSPETENLGRNASQGAESLLDNAIAQLREEKPSVTGYRAAVQQLTTYTSKPDQPLDFKLDPALRKLLMEDLLLRVPDSARRLKDLESTSFTIVDASHLDSCFLFHDAAKALRADLGDLPGKDEAAKWREFNLRLASHAFDWTMRQVQLTPRAAGSDVWPAHDILRRGTGDAEERLRVFLALMEQMDLFRVEARRLAQIRAALAEKPEASRQAALEKEKKDLEASIEKYRLEAVALTRQQTYRDDDGQTKTRMVPWAAGVLIDGELYVFDPRLGRPIAGPAGKGVATWKQVKADPKLLEAAYAGQADAVAATQLEKSEAWLPFVLASFAPRMNWLEDQLERRAGEASLDLLVVLHQEPLARLARLERANLGLPAKSWSKPGAPGYPLVVLNEYVENVNQNRRMRDTLVPRNLAPEWARELARELPSNEDRQRLFGDFDDLFLRLRVEPGGVRDLLVRGRPEEAVQRILVHDDRVDQALEFNMLDLSPVPQLKRDWLPKLIERSRRIRELQLQFTAADAATRQKIQEQLAEEYQKMLLLWKDRRQLLSQLAVVWAVPEYRAHLTYFMAVAKMDLARRAELLAERTQGQPWPEGRLTPEQLWQSAHDWLQRYRTVVMTAGIDPWRDAVDRQLEICSAELAKFKKKQ